MYPSNNNEHAGLSLPSPVTENISSTQLLKETQPIVESGMQNQNSTNASAESLTDHSTAQSQSYTQQPVSVSTGVNSTSNVVVPTLADDGDLIEKEWVNRAKALVEKTQNNPYEQSKELTIFKADYMKKRYNKIIKLSE